MEMPGTPAWLPGTVSWSAYCIRTESPYRPPIGKAVVGVVGVSSVQPVAALRVKSLVEIAADQGAHAQGAVVILLAVLGGADVHAHQDAQFGLQAKALGARVLRYSSAQVGNALIGCGSRI
jgi:hypothetical protein